MSVISCEKSGSNFLLAPCLWLAPSPEPWDASCPWCHPSSKAPKALDVSGCVGVWVLQARRNLAEHFSPTSTRRDPNSSTPPSFTSIAVGKRAETRISNNQTRKRILARAPMNNNEPSRCATSS